MFALRLAGVALICACGLLAGIKKSKDAFKKAELLRLISLFLDDICANIRYKQDNAISLLCTLSEQQKYQPLLLKFEVVQPPLWPSVRQKALEMSQKKLSAYISENEFDLFKDALCSLGQDTTERESEKLSFYKEKFVLLHKQAKEDAIQKQKLYTGVGFFAGAFAGIILL